MIQKKRLSEMAAEQVREMIKEAEFKAGDKIFSESELIRRLGVSRATVREAIRILEVTGLVIVHHGKGVFLKEQDVRPFESLREWLNEHHDTLFEQFEVRLLIEPEAAAVAAMRAKEPELTELRRLLERFREAVESGNLETAMTLDAEFHELLATATRNRTLSELMKTFSHRLTEGWVTSLQVPGRLEKTVEEHGSLLEALEARAPDEAREHMRQHLVNARNDIRAYFGTQSRTS
jgi:GntR family transcriptional repressor for pyruvate dehydrogenase complex